MSIDRLTWQRESPTGRPFHIERHVLAQLGTVGQHQHEFNEVFWCEAGAATHAIGEERHALAPGSLAFVRAADRHGIVAGPQGMTMVNVSFPVESGIDLARRFPEFWPWSPGQAPQARRCTRATLERLRTWSEDLASPAAADLELEAFLADLLRLTARGDASPSAAAPPWLRDSLDVFAGEARLASGVPGLARLCGRSIAQVNRVVRRYLGCTATDLVNRMRLDAAAASLRLCQGPVADIGAEYGFHHAGHFHRLFRERFGVTPAVYRREARGNALPPVTVHR